jgi:hypothetical protein
VGDILHLPDKGLKPYRIQVTNFSKARFEIKLI